MTDYGLRTGNDESKADGKRERVSGKRGRKTKQLTAEHSYLEKLQPPFRV
jgi:hypothetical protein